MYGGRSQAGGGGCGMTAAPNPPRPVRLWPSSRSLPVGAGLVPISVNLTTPRRGQVGELSLSLSRRLG